MGAGSWLAANGTLLAIFESEYRVQRLEGDHPDWRLDTIIEGQAVEAVL